MKKVAILGLVVLFTTSCIGQFGTSIKGSGTMVSINRSVGPYNEIAVSGWFDVDLIDGEEGELVLEGEENLLEYILTEVNNGKLTIKLENGIDLKPSNWNTGIRITVPVKSINALQLSGSADIVGKTTLRTSNFETTMSGSGDITLDLETESTSASMSGSGDMNLSGKTTNFSATISGSGDIKAYGLMADSVEATISGSADIEITANKALKARVSGSGDISYRGNPSKVDTKASGSGDISRG